MIACDANISTDSAIYLCVISWNYVNRFLKRRILSDNSKLRTLRVQYLKILLSNFGICNFQRFTLHLQG